MSADPTSAGGALSQLQRLAAQSNWVNATSPNGLEVRVPTPTGENVQLWASPVPDKPQVLHVQLQVGMYPKPAPEALFLRMAHWHAGGHSVTARTQERPEAVVVLVRQELWSDASGAGVREDAVRAIAARLRDAAASLGPLAQEAYRA